MAQYARKLPLLLFIILLTFTLHTESRESKFFSKTTPEKTKHNHDIVIAASLLAPAPAPESMSLVSSEGYGLYGHISSGDESGDVKPESESHDKEETSYTYNYKGYKSDNDAGNNNGYDDYKYENNGYINKKLGMSDTRLSENGKYYNNADNVKNYENRYGTERGNSDMSDGYNNNNVYEFDTMEEYEKQRGFTEIEGENYSP